MTRRRPSWLWLFFWGRRRRGFPWLLLVVLLLPVGLAVSYSLPAGVDLSRWFWMVPFAAIAVVTLAAIGLAVLASLRPPGRR